VLAIEMLTKLIRQKF